MTYPAVNSTQRFQNSYWLNRWDSIDTKFTSATCKIQPANLQPGKNEFDDINHKQSSIRVDGDTRNYLHTGTNDLKHPDYHNNLIYGNFLVDDIYKYWAIDRLLRLDVWDGIVYGGNQEVILERNISRPVILNTKMTRKTVTFPATTIASHTQYPVTVSSYSITGTYIPKNGAIFTNVLYNKSNRVFFKKIS